MKRALALTIAVSALGAAALFPLPAEAMCTCMLRPRPVVPVIRRPEEDLLLSDASMVVLMREGRRTILSMRNDYQGPPEDFAMLVPVPEVIERHQVDTLEHDVFNAVDRLTAPKLTEYWEQNPCGERARRMRPGALRASAAGAAAESADDALGGLGRGGVYRPPPVVVERTYSINEYDIQVLSANDSTGLETWLNENGFELPPGASEVLRPYVERGTRFFVAKVDSSRLRFENGRARLSPLRFHYDTDEFSLPIRLGLLNSPGQQDLVVVTIGRNRFEVANHPNVTIPTNLRLDDAVDDNFGKFYSALLDRAAARQPSGVITEYAELIDDNQLSRENLRSLGLDVTPSGDATGITITRMHYRYTRETIGDDLVFRNADPIGGGDDRPTAQGTLGTTTAERRLVNSFRARYAIFHPFEGPVACGNPRRGRWAGPPEGRRLTVNVADVADDAMDQGRLDSLVVGTSLAAIGMGPIQPQAIPQPQPQPAQIGIPGQGLPGVKPPDPPPPAPAAAAEESACSCRAAPGSMRSPALPALGALLGIAGLVTWRRRKRG